MIKERAHDWTTHLVPLLRGENQPGLLKLSLQEDDAFAINYEPSIEERVISSSLHLLLMKQQHGLTALFHQCAVFPQLARVPCAIFDAVTPAITSSVRCRNLAGAVDEPTAHEAPVTEQHVRAWLQQLLDYSLLQGSLDDGIGLHDLVRDYVLEAVGKRQL